MSTTSATVETLTAEVRVLQVGNRQITLSVAKQLDDVDLDDLEVMGRVHIWPERTHMVGRTADGSLAIAELEPPIGLGMPIPVSLDHTNAKLIACHQDREFRPAWCGGNEVKYVDWLRTPNVVRLTPGSVRRCGRGDHWVNGERVPCAPDAEHRFAVDLCAQAVRETRAERKSAWGEYRRMLETPLIVLAGLR